MTVSVMEKKALEVLFFFFQNILILRKISHTIIHSNLTIYIGHLKHSISSWLESYTNIPILNPWFYFSTLFLHNQKSRDTPVYFFCIFKSLVNSHIVYYVFLESTIFFFWQSKTVIFKMKTAILIQMCWSQPILSECLQVITLAHTYIHLTFNMKSSFANRKDMISFGLCKNSPERFLKY